MAAPTTDKIITPPFRLAFASLFTPSSYQGGEEKYSCTMIFPPDTDFTELKKIMSQAVLLKWPDKSKRPSKLSLPIRDADAEGISWEGFEGMKFARASTRFPPQLVDQKRQDIIDKDAIYDGCWCRAQILAYPYDVKGNRGVSFGLQHVQKVKDDEPISGGENAEDAFDDIDSGDDDVYSEENHDDIMGELGLD